MWARKNVSLTTCPKSYVTADSNAQVEEYFVRRRLGGMDLATLSARQAEAFLILEDAVEAEMRDGQQNSRNAF